ncbi:MAG: class I SAM-dependent methyltransferase [Verrucomicrobia bacterium]|nr:class I SAM-dependent methyltransferase [Verrucomicrobiota bacterium]
MSDFASARADRIAALGYNFAAQESAFVETCNLCAGDRWTILTHRDRYGFPAQTAMCDRCGLAVLNPRMTAAAYARFYASIYRPLISAFYGRQMDARTIQAAQQAYAEEMERFLAPFAPPGRTRSFLDVGGSTGVVAAHFARRFGFRGTVIDPAPDEVAEARALGIESVEGFVETWDPGGRTFDVIGLFQTIDHLLDVSATLAKIRRILAPGGLFVLDIVDFRAACLKRGSVEDATKIDHPYSLVEETAEAYLARAGFAPLRRAYSADHHLVAWICRACEPQPDALPPPGFAAAQRRELRAIQNAGAPPRGDVA